MLLLPSALCPLHVLGTGILTKPWEVVAEAPECPQPCCLLERLKNPRNGDLIGMDCGAGPVWETGDYWNMQGKKP